MLYLACMLNTYFDPSVSSASNLANWKLCVINKDSYSNRDSNHSYCHLTFVTPCKKKKKKKILLGLAALKAQAVSFLHSSLDKFMNCCTSTSLVRSSQKQCCDEARNLDPLTWLALCCHSSCVALKHNGKFFKENLTAFSSMRQWSLSANCWLWNCVADSSPLASHKATAFVCLSFSLSPSPRHFFFIHGFYEFTDSLLRKYLLKSRRVPGGYQN